MNAKNLLLLVCLLGFSSLAFAGIDVHFEQVTDGVAESEVSGRLLGNKGPYTCTFSLYTKKNIENNGGLLAFLNVYGPPYDGAINNLDTLGATPSYFHNLQRLVYNGPGCECTVTVYQGTKQTGKSKKYYSHVDVESSEDTKIDLDWCWSNKAESLSIVCEAPKA